MASVESRSLDVPDETRRPEKTAVDVVRLDSAEVGRFTFQPGWRWSECIKPVVGTDDCEAEHLGYALSGRMHILHADGVSVEIAAGDVYRIEPGHDAWVVGEEPFVGIEFVSADRYARG